MVAVAARDVSPHAVQGTSNCSSKVTAFTQFLTGEGYYYTWGLNCVMTLYPLRRLWSTGYINYLYLQCAVDCKRWTMSNRMMPSTNDKGQGRYQRKYRDLLRAPSQYFLGILRNTTKCISYQSRQAGLYWNLNPQHIKPASKNNIVFNLCFSCFRGKISKCSSSPPSVTSKTICISTFHIWNTQRA